MPAEPPHDDLLQIELDLTAYLALNPVLVDVHVLPQRTAKEDNSGGEIDDLVDAALAGLRDKNGKSGIAIIVMMPEAAPEDENLPGPQLDLECLIRIVENRIINEGGTGVGLSAPQLALVVSRWLHQWSPNGVTTLRPDRAHIQDITVPGTPGMEVRFRLRLPSEPVPMVATPVLTSAAGEGGAMQVTITCATSNAALFYSLDDAFPATPYEAPLVFAASGTLRVIAVAEGCRPSSVVEAEITPN